MEKKLLLFCIVGLLVNFHLGFAQDSIRIAKEIQRAKATMISTPDSCLIYANNIILWAKANSYNYQTAQGLKMKGAYFHVRGIPDSAIFYYGRAAEIDRQNNRLTEAGINNINIGNVYTRKGNFDMALKFSTSAYQYFDSISDKAHKILALRNIAQIYSLTGDNEKALTYFKEIYDDLSTTKDTINLAHATSNLGTVYITLGDMEQGKKYTLEALKMFEHVPDYTAMGACYQMLGNVFKNQQLLDSANIQYKLALRCYEISKYPLGLSQTYYNLGEFQDVRGHHDKAIHYFRKSIDFGLQAGDVDLPRLASKDLSADYAKIGDFKKAYETHVKYHDLSQQVLDHDKQTTIAQLETKFETAQKDKEIEIQKTQIAEQEYRILRNKQFIYALLSFLAIGILAFLYWRSRSKVKALQLQEKYGREIQQQRMMAIIDSQERERKRFTADLHDSFGQLISILKMNISELSDAAQKNSFSKMEKFHECKSVINDMYQELRNVVFDLLPQALVSGGLEPALKEFAARLNRSGKTLVEVLCYDLEGLSKDAEVALYRICQEWINNILKYSDATTITIQLTTDENELTLTIEDNGIGFDKNLLINSKGNGWKNINSRAGIFHGELDLETAPHTKGNLLILNIPKTEVQIKERKIPA
ncbi:MAG TPA: tetratricopeptide repeat protein [Sunxiuqinia sp.]|nr:tetratricopeptide repeat protein [Sunxiuqinia sp.]